VHLGDFGGERGAVQVFQIAGPTSLAQNLGGW